MEREKLLNLIQEVISQKKAGIDDLVKRKQMADGPNQSHSSHELSDLESEIEQEQKIFNQYQLIFEDAKNGKPSNVVGMGSIVDLIFVDNGKKQTFLISRGTGSLEGIQVISLNSPIGKAILGCKIEEEVIAEVPSGDIRLVIKSIY